MTAAAEPWGSERGGALVLSLLGLTVVGILSVSFMSFVSTLNKRQAQSIERKQSFYLAEAGLAEAVAGMRIGRTGNVGSSTDPALFGRGLFWVEAEETEPGVHSLTSTGMAGGTRVVLSVVVEEGSDSVAALGTFAEQGFTVPSGALLDAYASGEAAYGAGAASTPGTGFQISLGGILNTTTRTLEGDESLLKAIADSGDREEAEVGTPGVARVSSNGTIEVLELVGDTTKVDGDVRSGPELATSVSGSPAITGTTAALNLAVTLPAVTLPSIPQAAGVTYSGAVPYVAPAGEYGFAFLSVAPGSEVVLTGPATYLFDELRVQPGGALTFDTTLGPLSIFVRDEVIFEPGSTLDNLSADPLSLALQVAGTGAQLHADGEFHGLVYVPTGTIQLDESLEYFGSIVARTLDLSGAVRIHFDASLAAQSEIDALPDYLSWRILDMSSPRPTGGRTDNPFDLLGVNVATLSPPAASHEDQWVDIEYYDTTGIRSTYNGLESGFDWSLVRQTLTVVRDNDPVGGVEGLAGIGGVGGLSGVIGFAR